MSTRSLNCFLLRPLNRYHLDLDRVVGFFVFCDKSFREKIFPINLVT